MTAGPGPVQLGLEWVATGAVLVLLPLIGTEFSAFEVGFWPGVALVLLAFAVVAVSLVTYFATERFLWFGVAAFVSVGVFIGVATYFRTVEDPKVEAAAVLREDLRPTVGVFLADTADRVYLGTFAGGRGERRILVISRSKVTDLAIGPLLSPERAQRRALALALDLCNQQLERFGGPGANKRARSAAVSCEPGQGEAIRTQLAVAETIESARRATQVLAAFARPPTMHHVVPRRGRKDKVCLVRYEAEATENGNPSGPWWTVCREADRLKSVDKVRERLGLPERFQRLIDYRLRAEVPRGQRTSFLRGRVAPICEGPGDRPPCYAGGAIQYWFFDPGAVAEWITKRECSTDSADSAARWEPC